MSVQNFSPSKVVVTFGGYILTNWNSISVTKDYPAYRTITGIKGVNTRVKNINTAATIELDVPITSDINYILTAVASEDQIYGTGRLELIIKDALGTEIFSTTTAYVEDVPNRSYGKDLPSRTWILKCLSSTMLSQGEGWSAASLLDQITQSF